MKEVTESDNELHDMIKVSVEENDCRGCGRPGDDIGSLDFDGDNLVGGWEY